MKKFSLMNEFRVLLKYELGGILGFIVSTIVFYYCEFTGIDRTFNWFWANLVGGTILYVFARKAVFKGERKWIV